MNIKLFISQQNGFIHYRDENNIIVPVQILQDNVIKLNKDLVITENKTAYRIVPVPTTDGTATYRLVSAPVSNVTYTSGGGSKKGVNVFDDGTSLGSTQNLNFTGAGVTVTIVNGQAVINIPSGGAGMIGGGGTLNFIPKFTPDGTTIGDSLLFDNGTTVQMGGTGAINSAAFAITSTTQGFLAPRMTTVQRDAIVAPATALLVYNSSTSLFSYWDGAAWQNIDSQAGGDVSGSGTTGQLPMWTDGPNSVIGNSGIVAANVYVQNGNSFGANAVIGTNDAFAFMFETSGVTRGIIGATGLWGINTTPNAGTLLTVYGTGTTSATFIADFANATPTLLVRFRDDGYVSMGIANGSMTIGLGAGFNSALANNTFLGVNAGTAITTGTGTENTGVGTNALNSITDGIRNVAVGFNSLALLTVGQRNTAVGYGSGVLITIGSRNTVMGESAGGSMTIDFGHVAIGWSALSAQVGNSDTTEGKMNVAIGYNNLASNISGTSLSSVGAQALFSNTTGEQNTAIGALAGFTNITGSRSVYLGYEAGYFETLSDKLFIDSRRRTNEADGRVKALVYGEFNAATASQIFRINGTLQIREDFVAINKTINTTAGDSATINAIAGRFRKDTTGTTFTLTNSFITANSIINLTYASDSGITGFDFFVVAGAGSAVITFTTSGVAAAPTANTDINFLVIN